MIGHEKIMKSASLTSDARESLQKAMTSLREALCVCSKEWVSCPDVDVKIDIIDVGTVDSPNKYAIGEVSIGICAKEIIRG